MQPVPQISASDRQAALKRAAEVRKLRAAVLADFREGKITLSDVFEKSSDPIYGRIRVITLLRAIPRVGKIRATQALEEAGVRENRRVAGLGSKQRQMLLDFEAGFRK